MNAAASEATSSASNTAIEQIARSTGKAADLVEQIYQRTLQSLAGDARITQFIQVIAIRRTLIELKNH